jgi:hypothetical protein
LRTVCPGWPQTAILPISISQIARITGMNHWHLARKATFWKWTFFYNISFYIDDFSQREQCYQHPDQEAEQKVPAPFQSLPTPRILRSLTA